MQEGQANCFDFYDDSQPESSTTDGHYLNGRQELLSINLGVRVRRFRMDQHVLTVITEDDQFLRYELDPSFLSLGGPSKQPDGISLLVGSRHQLVIDVQAPPCGDVRAGQDVLGADSTDSECRHSPADQPWCQSVPLQNVPHHYLGYLYGFLARLEAAGGGGADARVQHQAVRYAGGFHVPGLLGVVPTRSGLAVVSSDGVRLCSSDGMVVSQRRFRRRVRRYVHKHDHLFLQLGDDFLAFEVGADIVPL